MENKSENCETIYWSGLVWPSWKIKQTELSDVTARSCPQLAWLAKVLASSGRDKTTTLLVVTITTSTSNYTRQTKTHFKVFGFLDARRQTLIGRRSIDFFLFIIL